MADFEKCVNFVLENEGGFVVDVGGATNFGITSKFLMEDHLYKYDLNKDGFIDQSDMKRFSREDAIEVYEGLFNRNFYNMLDKDDIAMRVFDMCVNAGMGIANRILQSCYNTILLQDTPIKELMKIKRLDIDGILGKVTLSCINSLKNSERLVFLYRKEREQFYLKLSESNPEKYGKYLKGWISRAYK